LFDKVQNQFGTILFFLSLKSREKENDWLFLSINCRTIRALFLKIVPNGLHDKRINRRQSSIMWLLNALNILLFVLIHHFFKGFTLFIFFGNIWVAIFEITQHQYNRNDNNTMIDSNFIFETDFFNSES
jgi:hypothetical protein